ncbi:M50 family metallopeptidase [Kitasatospora sp. NPDC088391]|uniref:M50 family metallopeptidase n=1 Tax=Kitasatospora sp. NPDC088391 TaxID=3364074 RepID=UPI003800C987
MDFAGLAGLWDRVTAVQPDPPHWLVWGTFAAALAAVAVRPVWRVLRTVVTIAHEGGHGLTALLTRRRLSGIRLHSDTSGLTVSSGKPTGPGMVLTAAAGYPAPSLLGLGGAALVAAGRTTALLWIGIALLAAMLLTLRNLFGVLAVLVTGGTFLAVSWYGSAEWQGAFAHLGVWFLLLAGVRPLLELWSSRRHGRTPGSDADQLARLTGVPGALWVVLFLLLALACLGLGAAWLLPR